MKSKPEPENTLSDPTTGIRVIGHNTSNYQTSVWYPDNLEWAKQFAETLAKASRMRVEIAIVVTTIEPVLPEVPIEVKEHDITAFIGAK